LAFLVPVPVLSDHEVFVEQLLAVPDEWDMWFEEEICNQLLLGTEAPGALEKEENGEYYKAEHISIPHMEPPAETVLPMLENAG
jgi:hypothetical protein